MISADIIVFFVVKMYSNKHEILCFSVLCPQGMSILAPLCGSGRFLVPFLERGFRIKGVDNSQELLEKLLKKAPNAAVIKCNIDQYQTSEQFDYIFISSGSVSLFTDMKLCKVILSKMKELLKNGGKFVFAVDTVAGRCPDRKDYSTEIAVDTKEGCRLLFKSNRQKCFYMNAVPSAKTAGRSFSRLFFTRRLCRRRKGEQKRLEVLEKMAEIVYCQAIFPPVDRYNSFL